MLDPQVSPEEIKSREVELGLRVGRLWFKQNFILLDFFRFSCFPTAELRTLSL